MHKYFWYKNKSRLVFAIIGNIVEAIVLVVVPVELGNITNALVYPSKELAIVPLVVRFVLLILATVAIIVFHNIALYRFRLNATINIETDLAKKLIAKPRSNSDVINIYNQEITMVVNRVLNNSLYLIYLVVSFGLSLYFGVSISWEIIIYLMSFIVLTMGVNQLFAKKFAELTQKVQQSNTAVSRVLNGVFSSIRTVNIFAARGLVLRKLTGVFKEKRDANTSDSRFRAWTGQLNNLLNYLTRYGLVIASYIMVFHGRLNVGQATTLSFLSEYLMAPMFEIIDVKNLISSTKEIRKKMSGILNEQNEMGGGSIPPGDINLHDISFDYDDQPFMKHINLEFKQGKRYLIVGKSGSGKSTLLRLILKELAPKFGVVTYGDKSIDEYTTEAWYQSIAYASQKVELIPGTLRENIVLDYTYDEKKFTTITRILNIDYLIDKFDELLDEDAGNFSGGELQRVSIARMLYKDCPIFIFDEFSSALDNINAYQIEKELLGIEGKLIISVTHRIQPDLLSDYDNIIIMDNGNVECVGTHTAMTSSLQAYIDGKGSGDASS